MEVEDERAGWVPEDAAALPGSENDESKVMCAGAERAGWVPEDSAALPGTQDEESQVRCPNKR
jgi:hypothetical protein